ncbi:helix-turn-helix domain-containing protein [Rhodobacter sphaeroides]|uniref:helix-turn-helix domain-containing protein n=1 Tax=Cereibacter sphaeroides TaxID=1063 RepID=UPI001329C833|nr:helix-turn-helix transcriptional regulator [Cereibacter sphaeroides]MWP38076.1 helix-turn-helix domain-containing protein [Cereibacter sphaeroides]
MSDGNYGQRLRAWREAQNLTQRAFSSALGVSRGYVGDIEARRSEPSRNFLQRLSEKFGISADWLLYGRGEPTAPPADMSTHSDHRCPEAEPPQPRIGDALRAQFGTALVFDPETPQPLAFAAWHEALDLEGSAPVGLGQNWLGAIALDPRNLRAVPIQRSSIQVPLRGTMLALVDPGAEQSGGPAPWAVIVDDQTWATNVEFKPRVTILSALRSDGSSAVLMDSERDMMVVLGRIVWLGVSSMDVS